MQYNVGIIILCMEGIDGDIPVTTPSITIAIAIYHKNT